MLQEPTYEQDNRRRIMHEALRLFTDQGYDAVGVQLLCSTAGISKPTLYHYFGNKRGLLDAVIQDIHARWSSELQPALAYEGDLPGTLSRIIRAVLELAASDPESLQLILTLQYAARSSESRRAADSLLAELRTAFERLFEKASAQHGNMKGRHKAYALSFLAVIFAYAELILNGDLQMQDELPHQIMHQFSHGIYS
ncbi:TetR/AcrR family transcriptional regulator [Spirochaeta dissipatitropha]